MDNTDYVRYSLSQSLRDSSIAIKGQTQLVFESRIRIRYPGLGTDIQKANQLLISSGVKVRHGSVINFFFLTVMFNSATG